MVSLSDCQFTPFDVIPRVDDAVIIAIINNSFIVAHEKKSIEFRTERGSMLIETMATNKPYNCDRWLQLLIPNDAEIYDSRDEGDKKK